MLSVLYFQTYKVSVSHTGAGGGTFQWVAVPHPREIQRGQSWYLFQGWARNALNAKRGCQNHEHLEEYIPTKDL